MCPGDWIHVVMLGGRHLSTLGHLTSTVSSLVWHFYTFWWWNFFPLFPSFKPFPLLSYPLLSTSSLYAITSSSGLWPPELERERDLSGPSLVPDEILLGPILCRSRQLAVSSWWVRRLRHVPKMSFRCIPLHPLALTLSLPLLEQHSSWREWYSCSI